MKYWNDYDVEVQARRVEGCPVRMTGVLIMARLMNWTNANSDGWAYWPKPVRSAKRLMELIETGENFPTYHTPLEDVTEAELRKAVTPIKSFLTRHGVDHDEIFGY